MNFEVIVHIFNDRSLFTNFRHARFTMKVINNNAMHINQIRDVFIRLSNEDLLTLIDLFLAFDFKINLINTIILRKKNITFHNVVENITFYLKYRDQHVTYVNVVRKQYLLRTKNDTAMHFRQKASFV